PEAASTRTTITSFFFIAPGIRLLVPSGKASGGPQRAEWEVGEGSECGSWKLQGERRDRYGIWWCCGMSRPGGGLAAPGQGEAHWHSACFEGRHDALPRFADYAEGRMTHLEPDATATAELMVEVPD